MKPGLAGLIDKQPRALDYEEDVVTVIHTGPPVRKQYEKGRVAYLPSIRFDGALPEFGPYFRVGFPFWKEPKNAQEFTDSIRWAAREDIPVQVGGPAYLVSNLVEQPDAHRTMLHLVNYNAKKVATLEPVPVTLRLPEGRVAKKVQVFSPDAAEPRTLEIKSAAAQVSFAVPLKTYSVAVISW